MKTKWILLVILLLQVSFTLTAQKGKKVNSDKPNILIIMPDDVGWFNIGAYNLNMMVPTPNIDRCKSSAKSVLI